MATTRTFGNMLMDKPVSKKPLDEEPKKVSIWGKMMKKGSK